MRQAYNRDFGLLPPYPGTLLDPAITARCQLPIRSVIVVASWVCIVATLIALLLIAGNFVGEPVPTTETVRDNLIAGGLLVLILVAVVLLVWADVRRHQRGIHYEHQQILSQLGALQAAVAEVRRAPVRAHAYIGRAVVSSTEEVATTEMARPASRRRRRQRPTMTDVEIAYELGKMARPDESV